MENKNEKLGFGIKSIAIIQLVILIVSFILGIGIIKSGYVAIGELSQWEIISLFASVITMISLFLILAKKKIGIYLYFIFAYSTHLFNLIRSNFEISEWISIGLTLLFAYFIFAKKDLFN